MQDKSGLMPIILGLIVAGSITLVAVTHIQANDRAANATPTPTSVATVTATKVTTITIVVTVTPSS